MENDINNYIENVYKVFKPYSVFGNLRSRSCECCITDNEIKLLLSKNLRELTKNDLRFFSKKAITTFGDVSDYKYFLPRILELFKSNFDLIGDFLDFEKLNYCNWNSWNDNEINAVKDYFLVLWENVFKSSLTNTDFENVFILVSKYAGIEDSLKIWRNHFNENGVHYIVDYILNGLRLDLLKKEEMFFQKWLSSKNILNLLENSFFNTKDQYLAQEISITYTILERDYGNSK